MSQFASVEVVESRLTMLMKARLHFNMKDCRTCVIGVGCSPMAIKTASCG